MAFIRLPPGTGLARVRARPEMVEMVQRPVAAADLELVRAADRLEHVGARVAHRRLDRRALRQERRDRRRQRAAGAVGVAGANALRGQLDDAIAVEQDVDERVARPVSALDEHVLRTERVQRARRSRASPRSSRRRRARAGRRPPADSGSAPSRGAGARASGRRRPPRAAAGRRSWRPSPGRARRRAARIGATPRRPRRSARATRACRSSPHRCARRRTACRAAASGTRAALRGCR